MISNDLSPIKVFFKSDTNNLKLAHEISKEFNISLINANNFK